MVWNIRQLMGSYKHISNREDVVKKIRGTRNNIIRGTNYLFL